MILLKSTLTHESYNNANFAVIGNTGGCHFDNLRCRQWRQSWYYVNSCFLVHVISISAKLVMVQNLSLTGMLRVIMKTPLAVGSDDTPTMMTSSNRNIFRVTSLLCGNSPSTVNSPHKDQWCGVLMFSLICAWRNDWLNNREAGDLRRHHAHHDVIVMTPTYLGTLKPV